ncbi:MAG: WbuC family cupin fold metalloprotein [Candidatus Aenigmatarchaeota archaeon]
MLKYEKETTDILIENAKKSDRKRLHYNFHKTNEEKLQRFLNAIEPESYVRPHKHLDTIEVFIIFKGKVALFTYDDNGEVTDKVVLEPGKTPGVEIPVNMWHSMMALEENSVLYIIMEGPYIADSHKRFPDWAPEESTKGKEFMKKLRSKL